MQLYHAKMITFRMSYQLSFPWYKSKNEDQKLLRTTAKRIILQFISRQHRYFKQIWLRQKSANPLETQQLVADFAKLGIYATNRNEQLTIALQCLVIYLQQTDIETLSSDENSKIMDTVLHQLESKFGNRYFHEFKIFRFKKLHKNPSHDPQHMRTYLLEHSHLDLEGQLQLEKTPLDNYNFPCETMLCKHKMKCPLIVANLTFDNRFS